MSSNAGVDGDGTGRHWVDRLARLGLAARGGVYLLVGWLALRIALEHASAQADRQGALHEIAGTTGGEVLLAVIALGFVGYALWRVGEALWGHRDSDGAGRLAKRAASGARAILYAVFTYSTVEVLVGAGSTGSDETSRQTTAGLLGKPFGQELVIAGGVGFVIAGLVLAIRGILRKFEDNLRTERMNDATRAVIAGLGVAGQTARGVVFALIGVFLVEAAVTYDPQKARGLDGSLRTLAQGDWGKALLVAVAVGLASFGLYSLAEARYRQT